MLARPLPTPVNLANCVNYFIKDLRRFADIENWDRDENGDLLGVMVMLRYSAEDRGYLDTDPPFDWMPLEMQRWMATELRGRWLFEVHRTYRTTSLVPRPMATVIFEKTVDAVLFKLRWHNADP